MRAQQLLGVQRELLPARVVRAATARGCLPRLVQRASLVAVEIFDLRCFDLTSVIILQ